MIEEEDDEEILKKGITIKSILKNIMVILLILSGALIIYFGNSDDMFSNWMIGFMLICFGSTLMQIQKPPAEPIRQTLTILACRLCGLTKVRNYENGDFVFNFSRQDKCTKCNDQMEVKQIYSVKLKQQVEQTKRDKDSKSTEVSDDIE